MRTSDWEMPNCRAITAGLMPALNAARTAFTCPRVKDIVATSTFRPGKDLPVDAERFGTDSRRVLVRWLGDNLPRRFASSRHAAMSRLSSRSLRCLTEFGRSFWARRASAAAPTTPLLPARMCLRATPLRTGRALLAVCDRGPWLGIMPPNHVGEQLRADVLPIDDSVCVRRPPMNSSS